VNGYKDFDLVQSKITPDLLNAGLQDFSETFRLMSMVPYYDMPLLRCLIKENYQKFHGLTPNEFCQNRIRYAASLVPLPVVTYLYNNYLLQQGLANLKIDWLFKHDLSAAFDRMLSGQQDAKAALETMLAAADAQVSSEWYKFTKLEDFRNYQRGVKLIMDVWKKQFGVRTNYPRELHIASYPGQALRNDASMCLLPVPGKRAAFFIEPRQLFREIEDPKTIIQKAEILQQRMRALQWSLQFLKADSAKQVRSDLRKMVKIFRTTRNNLILEAWTSLNETFPLLSGKIKARIIATPQDIWQSLNAGASVQNLIEEVVLRDYVQHYIHLSEAEFAFKEHLSSILQALQAAQNFGKHQDWWLFLRDTALYLNPETRQSCTQQYLDLALKPDEQNFYSASFWEAFLKNTKKAIGNHPEARDAASSVLKAFEPGINSVLKQNYHLPTPFIPITLELPN
jgi:hypothetical protein